jgi:hypothetical protein
MLLSALLAHCSQNKIGSKAMKLLLRVALIGGLFVLPSRAILAQSGPASVPITLQMKTGRAYKTGSPYCATKEYFPTKTPPNGTQVDHKGRICRDSLGRGREEISPTLIEIYDPVEGVGYTLDTIQRRAGRTAIARPPSPDSSASLPRSANFAPAVPSRVEFLGAEVIEGLVVEGTRRPTGLELLAKGEEEIWFSEELGEVILMKRSDGFYGSTVVWRLTDIDRSEPDPSLFRVPANYAIEDMSDYGDVPSPADSR